MKFLKANIIRKFWEKILLTNNYFRNFKRNLEKVNFVKYICSQNCSFTY